MRTVLPYFRPYMKGFMWGMVLVVAANAFQVAGPWLIRLAIDGLGSPGVTPARILMLAAMIVGAALLGGGARFGMRQLLNSMSRRMEADLRDDFFAHLLRLDATFYGSTRTGDLMSRATNDTLAVRMAVGPAVMYTVNTVVSFVFGMALMLYISPHLTVYAMIPMVILPPIVLGFGKIIHRRFEAIQEQFSTLSTMVQENLTGVRIVRAYTQEKDQARRFDTLNQDYRRRNMGLIYSAGAFYPMLGLIAGFAMVLVTWLGAREVVAGDISVGDFVAFGFYLMFLIWPMIALGWVVNLYQRGAASMGRINRILRTEPKVAAPSEGFVHGRGAGRVVFRDVSFAYPGTERPVLDGVSFEVEPGQTVALVGPTGSGKSTLVALLARLYDPTSGDVLLDGVPLTAFDPADLRRRIGMVPQDAFLFSDTIEGNIGLGIEQPPHHVVGAGTTGTRGADEPLSIHLRTDGETRQAVLRAARVAQLHDQIEAFPDGYETVLGERGINLSGGQKQRATLARALARDPLILVLDDALSAVDTHTEAQILTDLREELQGRTSFIISHRVSAVMNADQILVLDGGRIVERGTHAQLIAAGGTYARLLRRQMLEETLEADQVTAV
ncbi:MAG: ABC transporter ATP-binding protein/permease [Gemmatimonadetes bacterium]|nr:ABC transporter ATP-binding protein/permease [Gemmatimonadota bacterium]